MWKLPGLELLGRETSGFSSRPDRQTSRVVVRGRGRGPVSCTGTVWAVVGNTYSGRFVMLWTARARVVLVPGRSGTALGNCGNPKAEVRSPKVLRRHWVMFGIVTPVQLSRNCSTEV